MRVFGDLAIKKTLWLSPSKMLGSLTLRRVSCHVLRTLKYVSGHPGDKE